MKFGIKLSRTSLFFFLIIVFTFVSRLWRLNQPDQMYFDEAYHVPAAGLIAQGDVRAFEWWHGPIFGQSNHDWLHPPLAKYVQAGFIHLGGWFGWQASFSWRLPSVLAGVMAVSLAFILAQVLFIESKSRDKLALVAAFLVSLSGLMLVQSRIAMNDIFVVVWMMLALILVWRQQANQKNKANLIWLGLVIGLGLATKWSMIFVCLFCLGWLGWLILKQQSWKQLAWVIFCLVLLPGLIYLLSYLPMFLQGKTLGDWWQLHEQIIWYQTHREANHAYASTPFKWWLNLRPVWYWQDQALLSSEQLTANIYALGNPALHWLGLLSLALALLSLVWNRHRQKFKKELLFILTAFFITWLPWILSPRIMFYYHYLPAVPLLAIIVAWFLVEKVEPRSKSIFYLSLSLIFISFVIFYPHWTGLAVSKTWVDKVYFFLESWK